MKRDKNHSHKDLIDVIVYNETHGKTRYGSWEDEKDPFTQDQKKTCDKVRNAGKKS